MTPTHGMLSIEALREAVLQGEVHTVLVVFPDLYGRLLGKRLTARFFLDHGAADGMHVCNYLVACDMEMDPVPGYRFANWEAGYGDLHAVPDMTTLRRAAWLPGTAMVLCDLQQTGIHAPVEVAPRRMLQRQLEQTAKLGYAVMGGTELETYLFHETYESARAKNHRNLATSGTFIEDYHVLQGTKEEELLHAVRRDLELSGVPVESTKGEWGPGQQEINLAYSEALAQADRAVLCKHAVKEIAHFQGKAVTFMAKWDEKLAGNGLHVHLSLWDRGHERNLFAGEEEFCGLRCSPLFRWFLGGMLERARAVSALLAPYPASYKRFQSGSFAPTTIAWSRDNRTAGFRVVGSGSSLRIECRIAGADANPYLVYAALVAAGLEGIAAKAEPPRAFEGDVYQARELPQLPSHLREAVAEFEASDFVREAFGEEVVEHYAHFFRTEQRKFDEVVTDWELGRYFERV